MALQIRIRKNYLILGGIAAVIGAYAWYNTKRAEALITRVGTVGTLRSDTPYSSQPEGSGDLGVLPGGTQFQITGQSGDFYQVQMSGAAAGVPQGGWVPAANVG